MKKLFLFVLLLIFSPVFSQNDTIEITQFKTTQIIFKNNISFVEPGTGDLQVKYKMIDNILILQSMVPESDFINTNLFIKTDDNVYNPIIKYSKSPRRQTIAEESLRTALSNSQSNTTYKLTDKNTNSVVLNKTENKDKNQANVQSRDLPLFNKIVSLNDAYKPSRAYETGVWFRFYAHYIVKDKFYFKLELENTTELDYNIEHIFFSIKNRRKKNATVTQREINYTKALNDVKVVPAKSKQYIIYEFNSFSINKDEEVMIELKEKNGARNFVFGIPYFIINRPLTLN